MDLMILRKKIDGFRSGNGQLQNVPPELLFELRQAWENYPGSPAQFRRELGMKVGTLRKLLVDSKKLNHVLASSEAMGLGDPVSDPAFAQTEIGGASFAAHLELIYDHGSKTIRFPNLDTLLEFLKKAA